jgi:triphosphoribosyl-dephospho-CoA synthase
LTHFSQLRPVTTARGHVDVAAAAQLACLLEVSAPKPGNVSPGRHFADTRYEHFLASAAAIGRAFQEVATQPLGVTIREAIEATVQWAPANTNLGIVLLLAPLARSVRRQPDLTLTGNVDGPAHAGHYDRQLQDELRRVLATTTVADARDVYAAIRLASPGGLGRADEQDVAQEPTRPLVDVMRLAADRDAIAREYATAFATTFDTSVPALRRARGDGLSWDDAIVETFLDVLAAEPDTHIARRAGLRAAADVSHLARDVRAAGGVRSAAGRTALAAMDDALRDPGNRANPGATADLTAAAILVVLLGRGWRADSEGNDAATR